jgi:hypothetical protein
MNQKKVLRHLPGKARSSSSMPISEDFPAKGREVCAKGDSATRYSRFGGKII